MRTQRWARAVRVGPALIGVVAVATSCGATAPPPPRFARSVDIGLVSGTVLVEPIAGSSFRLGARDRSIPVGSELDTTLGEVDLRSARPPGHTAAATNATTIQDGQFSGALFKILQRKGEHGLTELDLVTTSKLRGLCVAASKATVGQLSDRVLQTLRAHDNGGLFRTSGRFSAATVRGTVWDTIDRCDGTYTVVYRGSVYVYNYVDRKTIIVRAGHSYLATAPTG